MWEVVFGMQLMTLVDYRRLMLMMMDVFLGRRRQMLGSAATARRLVGRSRCSAGSATGSRPAVPHQRGWQSGDRRQKDKHGR